MQRGFCAWPALTMRSLSEWKLAVLERILDSYNNLKLVTDSCKTLGTFGRGIVLVRKGDEHLRLALINWGYL